jgi:hypothetical protein
MHAVHLIFWVFGVLSWRRLTMFKRKRSLKTLVYLLVKAKRAETNLAHDGNRHGKAEPTNAMRIGGVTTHHKRYFPI